MQNRSTNRLIISCKRCQVEVSIVPSKLGKTKFCSKTCYDQWQRESGEVGEKHHNYSKIALTCANCEKAFSRSRHRVKSQVNHFCGPTCRSSWQAKAMLGANNPVYSRKQVTCEHCNAVLERIAARLRNNKWHFCGHKCYGAWRNGRFTADQNGAWLGGYKNYYGPNWRSQQKKARQRDADTCQSCGVTKAELGKKLDVHHVKPFRLFGYVKGENKNYKLANDLDNLLSLCSSCHMQTERALQKAMRLQTAP